MDEPGSPEPSLGDVAEGQFFVFVLEDEADQYREYRESYLDIFSFANPVFIDRIENRSKVAQYLKSYRPHVLICDVQLGDDSRSGLAVIAEHKGAYPDTVFIACTREELDIKTFGLQFPNPDLVITKNYLNALLPRYRGYLQTVLSRMVRRGRSIDWYLRCDGSSATALTGSEGLAQAFAEMRGGKPNDAELRSMLSQVTFVSHDPDRRTSIRKVELAVQGGGHSGSAVFVMRAFSDSGDRVGVDRILKISKEDRTRTELGNYDRFVKWYLPYSWRVDVLGYGFAGRFGAICYSLVHGSSRAKKKEVSSSANSGPVELTVHLQKGGKRAAGAIRKVLDSVLHHESQAWYATRRAGERDLAQHYSGPPYFWNDTLRDEAAEKFWTKLESFAGKAGIAASAKSKTFDHRSVPDPQKLLFTQSWGKYAECICHGDLNSGNLLFDRDTRGVAFIDFQQTGYLHICRDFVSFESSVRLEMPGAGRSAGPKLRKHIQSEEQILAAEWSVSADSHEPYAREVMHIRRRAKDNFADLSFSEYVFATCVHHLTLLRKDRPEDATCRLLAVIVTSLRWLHAHRDRRAPG